MAEDQETRPLALPSRRLRAAGRSPLNLGIHLPTRRRHLQLFWLEISRKDSLFAANHNASEAFETMQESGAHALRTAHNDPHLLEYTVLP